MHRQKIIRLARKEMNLNCPTRDLEHLVQLSKQRQCALTPASVELRRDVMS